MFIKYVPRFALAAVAAVCLGGRPAAAVETMADYTDVPFFMSNVVQPNIMVIADNSGSMNEFAYSGAYDTTKTYSGYFTPGFQYSYDGTKWIINAAGTFSGSFLNWACMRKIDVARKVLVGGLATSRTGGGNQVNKGENSPTSWNQTHADLTVTLPAGTTGHNPDATYKYGYKIIGDKLYVYKKQKSNGSTVATYTYNNWIQKNSTLEPDSFVNGNLSGVMQKVATKARWGLAFFDSASNGGYVAEPIVGSGYGTNFITTYENKAPSTMTPLAETLYQVIGYFKQDATIRFAPGNYSTNVQGKDPFWYSDTSEYVACGKNFVLYITDGEPTSDTNIPASLQDYDGDGNDSTAGWALSGSDYVDDVALWGHTVDLRSDITGTQVITLYAVYTFGTSAKARQLLKDAAKNGAFVDSNGNNRPDLQSEYDTDGDGVPDTYFEADDADSMESQIMAAITDILKRASSGTAISVLATSASGAGNIFQAYFLPSKTIIDAAGTRELTWTGHMLSLNIDANGSMRDKNNTCINFTYDTTSNETVINTLNESSGVCGTTVSSTTPLTSFVNYNWDAGDILASRSASTRTLFTFMDANKNGVMDSGERIDFTTANASTLQKYLRTSSLTEAQNVISWIRGSTVSGYRDRTLNVGGDQYKLGDIIHSTPTVVGAPQENYSLLYQDAGYSAFYDAKKSRTQMVYIGANDGILHAFDVATGTEQWGYIPYNLLPHLKWLTDTAYTHVDYIDLKVKVSDINFGTSGAPDWRTVLIGGMRFGGGEISDTTYDVDGDGDSPASKLRKWRSSFFAIDITNPSSPTVLWEFGHNLANYGLTDNALGFSFTYPAVAKVGDSFFAIVGTGGQASYVPLYDGSSSQAARLFVINIKTGALAASFPVTDTASFFADPVTVDVDFSTTNPVTNGTGPSYNTDAVYLGETYWKSTGGGSWNGRMWRLITNNDANPANWVMYNLYNTATGQGITAAPATSTDSQGNLWIYFGTGKFLSQADKTDAATQSFYGIKDPCWDAATGSWGGAGCTLGSLNSAGSYTASVASSTLVNVTSAVVKTDGSLTGVTGATSFSGLETLILSSKNGWYLNFPSSKERSLNKPTVIGGLVLFTTFIPTSDVCGLGGNSYFYAAYFTTGTAYYKSIIGTSSSDATVVLRRSESSSVGMASSIAVHAGRETGAKAYIQMSTGQATVVDFTTALSIKSGIIAWREL